MFYNSFFTLTDNTIDNVEVCDGFNDVNNYELFICDDVTGKKLVNIEIDDFYDVIHIHTKNTKVKCYARSQAGCVYVYYKNFQIGFIQVYAKSMLLPKKFDIVDD